VAGDPHRLHLTTTLNDEVMQDSDTSLMVFSVADLIEYASARVTLNPGDMISTGTPYGVGGFRKIFLKPGDRLRVAIEVVGALENTGVNG
jgi:2-keto-4-pentenoate hydratase/2-oxohepta-3-ene-1,7-dioic acid hydratase in catechol pathway